MDLIALKAQLRQDEGLRLRPYRDLKGKITIGFGHNLTDKGITIDQAEAFLESDIQETIANIRSKWTPFDTLCDARQQVLVNMGFNLGVNGLLLFRNMLAACARGEFETAAMEIEHSTLAAQVGARAHRLARMMRAGV